MSKINFELIPVEVINFQNAEFFMVKQGVIEKIYQLFGLISEEYEQLFEPVQQHLTGSEEISRPKISRGENYLHQPYVMLDYPRHFKTNETLAIRSLFWWGNDFSIHLILSSGFVLQFETSIINAMENELDDQWYYSFTDDPWHHHFNPDNYESIKSFQTKEGKYFKLAKKLPLHQWPEAETFFIESFSKLVSLLKK